MSMAKTADKQPGNDPNGKRDEHDKFPYLEQKWHILILGRLFYIPVKSIWVHWRHSLLE